MGDDEEKRDKRNRTKDGPVTDCSIERFARINSVSVEETSSLIRQFGADPTVTRKVQK